MLEDGTYDVMVVDTEVDADATVHVELAVAGGPHRGEVVSVRATTVPGDPLDLLGLPGTLTVRDGRPSLQM